MEKKRKTLYTNCVATLDLFFAFGLGLGYWICDMGFGMR